MPGLSGEFSYQVPRRGRYASLSQSSTFHLTQDEEFVFHEEAENDDGWTLNSFVIPRSVKSYGDVASKISGQDHEFQIRFWENVSLIVDMLEEFSDCL